MEEEVVRPAAGWRAGCCGVAACVGLLKICTFPLLMEEGIPVTLSFTAAAAVRQTVHVPSSNTNGGGSGRDREDVLKYVLIIAAHPVASNQVLRQQANPWPT